MISRKEMHQEFLLRESIQKTIRNNKETHLESLRKSVLEEVSLRGLIQGILKEAVKDPSSDPHSNTGINFLTTLFRNTNFLATLEDVYKSLTTDDKQRASFKSHIMNAVDMTFQSVDGLGDEEEIQEIDIEIPKQDTPGYVERDTESKEEKEEKEKEDFELPGKDETGRNTAFETYGNIEKSLIDQYVALGNQEDKDMFKKYLVLNLNHYFDEWESELSIDADNDESFMDSGEELTDF